MPEPATGMASANVTCGRTMITGVKEGVRKGVKESVKKNAARAREAVV